MIMYEVLSNRVMGAVIYSSRQMHRDGMESVIVKNPKILGGTPAFGVRACRSSFWSTR
jgi:hypothetical protein